MNFKELREKYLELCFESYQIEQKQDSLLLTFHYTLKEESGKIDFSHQLIYEYKKQGENQAFALEKNRIEELENFVFQIGVAESISYWKLACPKTLRIACGYLNEEQIAFWKKLYYNGLGEFIYLNRIHLEEPAVTEENLVEIVCEGNALPCVSGAEYHGTLIPVGGGKDSVMTLELLQDSAEDNLPFVMSPPQAAYDCIAVAGYEHYLLVTRKLDAQIIQMNSQGYLNGHVPFSAILAFIAALGAALTGKKYIALSNEKSANEPSVVGTNFNHQYSKTLEFERDFTDYFQSYVMEGIAYFSLLRPLYEIEIAKAFARYEAYHEVFRSCNRGKKTNDWCGSCSKCLFVYIMLSPYIERRRLAEIFGKDLYQDESLAPILLELLGLTESKPFECVGTIWEVRYALAETVEKYGYGKENAETPALIKLFLEQGELSAVPQDNYETGHLVPKEFQDLFPTPIGEKR